MREMSKDESRAGISRKTRRLLGDATRRAGQFGPRKLDKTQPFRRRKKRDARKVVAKRKKKKPRMKTQGGLLRARWSKEL